MEKRILLIVLLSAALLYGIQAQREVLTTGGDFSSAGGSVAFSIGQIAYTYHGSESGNVSLGVQQPNLFNIVATEDIEPLDAVSLYPNPASEIVYVDLQDESLIKKYNSLSIRLFDMQGKLITQQEINQVVTPFTLTNMSEAVYLLQIMHEQQPIKSFKLYKSN
jgi:opacity protein-like surface antigen